MKNWKHWAFAAMVAIFAIAIIGCKEDEPTEQPQPVAQKWTVDLGGGKKVEVNYMAVSVVVPLYLSRLEPVFQDIAAGMPTATYIINVEYGSTSYDGFISVEPVGSHTLKVHNNWISSVSDSVCFSSLGNVLVAWFTNP